MDEPLHLALFVIVVLAAAGWAVSLLVVEVVGTNVRARGDGDAAVAFAARFQRVTRLVTMPCAFASLLAGAWLVRDHADWALDEDWWIGACLATWLVAFCGSTMLRAARLQHLVASTAKHGADSEDVRWRLRQVLLIGRGELLLLGVAIALLALRPS